MTTILSVGQDLSDIFDEAMQMLSSVGDIGTTIVSAVTGQGGG
jgi:hypothetical protein